MIAKTAIEELMKKFEKPGNTRAQEDDILFSIYALLPHLFTEQEERESHAYTKGYIPARETALIYPDSDRG